MSNLFGQQLCQISFRELKDDYDCKIYAQEVHCFFCVIRDLAITSRSIVRTATLCQVNVTLRKDRVWAVVAITISRLSRFDMEICERLSSHFFTWTAFTVTVFGLCVRSQARAILTIRTWRGIGTRTASWALASATSYRTLRPFSPLRVTAITWKQLVG